MRGGRWEERPLARSPAVGVVAGGSMASGYRREEGRGWRRTGGGDGSAGGGRGGAPGRGQTTGGRWPAAGASRSY